MSYSEIGLAFVGIVLLAIISYVLLNPATPGKDCPSDEVFNLRCGQCAPKDCIPDNVDCDQGAKVAKCSCPPGQILCGGKCYLNSLVYCDDKGNPKCIGSQNNTVCGTGSTTTCCQPGTKCIDGICGGEDCKDPQICNNSEGNQCCPTTQKCLCVGGTGPIGQCSPGTTNNNTCCSPENTIMHDNSVNGINECCAYQVANCDNDGKNCTGKNTLGNKWYCCPGDFNKDTGECAVACGDKDGKKIFCTDKEYCMAITDTTGNTTYSCANNTCTWDSEMTYPQIKNFAYAFTPDCMNPAAFVENENVNGTTPFSNRQNYVCEKTYDSLSDAGRGYFNPQSNTSYYNTLRFFRAKSTMDSKGTPLCNANDCTKKLSNYGDVTEMYNETTGECWGNQTMKSYCGSEKEKQYLLSALDSKDCGNLTNVPNFLNYFDDADKEKAGICPFPLNNILQDGGGCGDWDAPKIY